MADDPNPPPKDPPPKDPPTDPPPSDPPSDPPTDPPTDPPIGHSVTLEEHQKTLTRLKSLEEERDALKKTSKDSELQQMKDQERWKEIAELKTREAEEANEKVDNMSTALQKREKMSSIRNAATQAGLRKDALDLLDLMEFPEVQIEATTLGNINIVGVSTAIEALKLKHPSLFGKKSGNLNGGLPEVVDGGSVTIDHLLKAEEKAGKTGLADDKAAYFKITKQYKQQQRQRGS